MEFDPALGEDTWELFEAIDDSFGVNLGDYHEICGKTVRELAEIISTKANYPTNEKCLSAVTFYRLRRAFGSLFGISRSAIRPAAPVSELLPLKHRIARWKALQEHLGLTLPGLQFPIWLPLLALVTPPALLLFLRAFVGVRLSTIWIFDISCALYMVTVVSIIPVVDECFPLSRVLPRTCETFGGLVNVVSAQNYAALGGSSGENDVLKTMRQLISMQVGVGIEEVSPETRIPHDLSIY
jgi:hypothetical protein